MEVKAGKRAYETRVVPFTSVPLHVTFKFNIWKGLVVQGSPPSCIYGGPFRVQCPMGASNGAFGFLILSLFVQSKIDNIKCLYKIIYGYSRKANTVLMN